ncbi:hypothetical protein C8Q70DRAFT_337783 [Cubamyces menziesii]|nr:hypothetical protein C8Q70DRAFT_337783 [Cubamyces menziesii]
MYPDDPFRLKTLVWLILCLDISQTVISCHVCYYYLVKNYFSPRSMAVRCWSMRLGTVETGLVIMTSHCSHVWRRYGLQSPADFSVTVSNVVLLILESGFWVATMVESLIQNSFNNFSKFQWMIWASISITMAFDIFLAIQFVLEYYYIKKQITSRGMVLVLGMLMAQMIHAGLSTSALVLTTLIYAIISPHELIWAAIMVVGTRVYLNVVLSFLNARQSLKDVLSDDNLGWGGGITALSRTPHTLDLRPGGRRLQQTQVRRHANVSVKLCDSFDSGATRIACDR